METRLLKMFIAVAERGSLVEAARQLHLTPSAISHGLKALETEVGCRLFDRVGKRVILNEAGEQLLAQIRQPLAALDAAAASLKRLSHWGQTRLRIGAAASTCQHIVPAVVRELKRDFQNLALQVESGDMPHMVNLVREGRIDLALGIAPEAQTDLEFRPVFRDELLFTFAATHPWCSARSLSRDDLRKASLIYYQRTSLTAHLVNDYFRSLGVEPSTVMEVASIEAIKELVKLNLGVGVLAPWAADNELARGTLRMRPIGPRPLRRQWVVVSLAGRRLGLAEETFCRACRNVASGLRMDRRDVPSFKG